MEREALRYCWTAEDEGERLDKILAVKLSLSRTQLQSWLRDGRVESGGKKLNSKDRIAPGSEITIHPPAPVPLELKGEDRPLDVIYEDPDLLVLNKKAGDVVHPGAGHWEGTLVQALIHHCRGQLSGIGGVERPGIVHRLDRETSGVLLVAKTDRAHQNLSAQFKDRSTEKFYSAFVLGKLPRPRGEWTGAIARHSRQRQKMAVVSGGKEARTGYEVLASWARASKLLLRIYTGRTHQIRVHAAAAGCPVLGDSLYGRKVAWGDAVGMDRQLLHAKRLVFTHPRTGKRMDVEAPEPELFGRVERYLESGA